MSALPQPEADLFAAADTGQRIFSGHVLHNAEARTRIADHDGHSVPVLCFDMVVASGNHIRVYTEFPPGAHDQAAAAARRYKKGTRVAFESSMRDLLLIAHNASHVRVLGAEEAAP